MGIVREYLIALISKQVSDHRIVVWYDPERHYSEIVASLNVAQTHVASYEDSFFKLRHEIEGFLGGLEPQRLVVYVPMEKARSHEALVEVEEAGVVMQPGQQPPTRNTRLSLLARNALRPVIGEANAAAIEKQVESGKLSLNDLDLLGEQGEGITRGVVAVIFSSSNPQDIALRLLANARHDSEIVQKDAGPELVMLLNSAYDGNLSATDAPPDMRIGLARHLISTEFFCSLCGEIPMSLSSVKVAEKAAAKSASVALVNEWRNRQDLRDSYAALANQVERQFELSSVTFQLETITKTQTFSGIEKILAEKVAAKILEGATEDLVNLAEARQSSFWSEYLPDMQARWALVSMTGQLLLETDRLEKEIKSSSAAASNWFAAYTQGKRPWCLLDTYQRHMERRYHNFDFEVSEDGGLLGQLVAKARHRYMQAGGSLSDQFLRRFSEEKFRVNALRQLEIYEKRVRPQVAEGKTAYVWVDALRFEMGRELAQTLTENFEVTCEAAVAAVPTITEIGMAALLPGEEKKVIASPTATGKVALNIDGTTIKDRKDRVNQLREKAGVDVFDVKLEELLPKPRKRVVDGVREADLILMTSQEIDALCEGDNVPLARRTMDAILHELHRGFRVLASLGVERFVISADHGYLFGDELDESMKTDPPGGETIDLHRRVWVGRGGDADSSFLRGTLKEFGLGGDLEIATPWGFGCFKAKGGAKAFFHGGLSLQELIVPVITLVPLQTSTFSRGSSFDWTLVPGSEKISTRFFSVQIKGAASQFFELIPPKVRVEIRVKGKPISTPVSASYGFEDGTGDVQLKMTESTERTIEPNTVTLLIQDGFSQEKASVHLLDAATGVELKRLDKIELTISI